MFTVTNKRAGCFKLTTDTGTPSFKVANLLFLLITFIRDLAMQGHEELLT